MQLSKIWWTRVANAARFLGDVCEALRTGQSVVLDFDSEIPWMDTMIEEIELECSNMTDTKMFRHLEYDDSTTSPGEFLMNHFCSEAERNTYWPTKYRSREHFLAKSRNTTLRHRFVCITGVEGSTADKWVCGAADYLENFKEEDEHGVFILITKNVKVKSAHGFCFLKYSDYITDYDCMMLCLNLLAPMPYSRIKKMYLAEIASGITDNNIEIAGQLICQNDDLAVDPQDIIKRFFHDNLIEDSNLNDKIEKVVWEAQIRLVFPQIETFRRSWIRKYESQLTKHLPMKSSYGETIKKVSELEINQLATLNVNESEAERKYLIKMRDARNTLAHIGILKYNELSDLKIF